MNSKTEPVTEIEAVDAVESARTPWIVPSFERLSTSSAELGVGVQPDAEGTS
jgi:hypothetical protein